jgi:CheB methylesterase
MARLVSWRSGAGGFTIVQDPEDALYAQMPASAMHFAHPDAVVPADDMAKTVVAATQGLVDGTPEVPMRSDERETTGPTIIRGGSPG